MPAPGAHQKGAPVDPARHRTVAALVALAVATVYTGFLGWDQTKDVDPVTGALTGPYSTGQVIACGLAYLLVVAAGSIWSPVVAGVVATVTFTLAWSLTAATDPLDQGLWLIGAVLVLIGTAAGAALAAAVNAARAGVRARRGTGPP